MIMKKKKEFSIPRPFDGCGSKKNTTLFEFLYRGL